jgi:hypothetical protein
MTETAAQAPPLDTSLLRRRLFDTVTEAVALHSTQSGSAEEVP